MAELETEYHIRLGSGRTLKVGDPGVAEAYARRGRRVTARSRRAA